MLGCSGTNFRDISTNRSQVVIQNTWQYMASLETECGITTDSYCDVRLYCNIIESGDISALGGALMGVC